MTIRGYAMRPLRIIYAISTENALRQIDAPFPLDFVARWHVKGPMAARHLETRFSAYKMNGAGWFRPHAEVLAFISEKDQEEIKRKCKS